MIIRHIPMKSIQKSSFSGLIAYLTQAQGKHERVGEIRVTNCHSRDTSWAVHEIEATQHQNQRAKGDRTYHLLISFPAGETPSAEVLKDIENKVCASIGYQDHQRISVVHHDTDNFHIHVGINKIHPSSHTLHEPYHAYKKLASIAATLELEHGLQVTNHVPHKRGSENRADDMEHHSGIESLLNWIKHSATTQMHAATSWSDMHTVLQDNGLELRERGNGFVIVDCTGLSVKASSVSRDFSKAKLEQKLGAFQKKVNHHLVLKPEYFNKLKPSAIGTLPPPRAQHRFSSLSQLASVTMDNGHRYAPLPMDTSFNTDRLFAQYQTERQYSRSYYKQELARARSKKNRLMEAAKRSSRLKRAAIKLLKRSGINKKVLYALAGKTLKADISTARLQYLKEKNALDDKYQQRTWADWLKLNATKGNAEALAALRARNTKSTENTQGIAGHGTTKGQGASPNPLRDNITKKGTIIYRVGDCAVRDNGHVFTFSKGVTQEGIYIALRMAIHRYGSCLTVNGSDEFKNNIVQTAARLNLEITFDDPALEQRRQLLLNTSPTENNHELRTKPTKCRSTNRSGHEGFGTVRSKHPGAQRTRGTDGNSVNKPNLRLIGQHPPPESQNRLRNLSQLRLVQLARGSEVLLPSDVPHHLEHQRAKPDNGLRRSFSGAGALTKTSMAADKYIAERSLMRQKVTDIPIHRYHQSGDEGQVQFAGLRQVEGEMLALLKKGSDILVVPIDTATSRQMKRLSIGDNVKVTSKGMVISGSRTR